MLPTLESIEKAYQRIKPYIHKTDLRESQFFKEQTGTQALYFKCQNFQKIGAFKARGACNTLLKLLEKQKEEAKERSVCTHSSGNHAMALSYMAKVLGFTAYVVMPQNSPLVKKQSVIGYGGVVVESGNTVKDREQKCIEVSQKYGATIVHAYDNLDVIEGQGTCALEIFKELENRGEQLDFIVFPIGGGGLGSGTILATKQYAPHCKCIGVEPYLARDAFLSLQRSQHHEQLPPITIADGLRVNLGKNPYSIISNNLSVDDVILVEEEQIIDAMKLFFQRMKIIIQPSSATVVAALLKQAQKQDGGRFKNKRVACILTGGNVDMSAFFKALYQKVSS